MVITSTIQFTAVQKMQASFGDNSSMLTLSVQLTVYEYRAGFERLILTEEKARRAGNGSRMAEDQENNTAMP